MFLHSTWAWGSGNVVDISTLLKRFSIFYLFFALSQSHNNCRFPPPPPIEHEWNPRITAVLDIVVEDDWISPYMCIKYRKRLTTWEDAINDLNAFRKLVQSSLQAQKKRTKVPRHDFSTIDIVPLQYMT